MTPTRHEFLMLACAFPRVPYLWGGKGDTLLVLERNADGQVIGTRREPLDCLAFDCSGFVTWCLYRAFGEDLRFRWNTDSMLRELDPTDSPQPGDLCLYGRPMDAEHVMVWLGGRVIGASGGNSDTTSIELARARRQWVKFKDSHTYRPDFIGFRSMSQHLTS